MSDLIQELDRVVLTRPVSEHGLEPGDVGTVVGVHDDGRGYTVEFMSLDGKTIAVVTERAEAFRPIRPREVTHARQVA
jgi:hypothetical protein